MPTASAQHLSLLKGKNVTGGQAVVRERGQELRLGDVPDAVDLDPKSRAQRVKLFLISCRPSPKRGSARKSGGDSSFHENSAIRYRCRTLPELLLARLAQLRYEKANLSPSGGSAMRFQPRSGSKLYLVCALALALALPLGCKHEEFDGVFITMTDNTFSPREIRIPVGGHVLFRSLGATQHNIIAVDGLFTSVWNPEEHVEPGNWYEVTFDKEGVYPFYCSLHGMPDASKGMAGVVLVGDVEYTPETAERGKLEPVEEPTGVVRHVPAEYPDIQTAVDAADPGDLVLIAEGIYHEEVLVSTPSITIRGTDRNAVVLDGEFERGNGIMVFADGVAIENLTARNYNLNGFYWTGITGYRGSYITAVNNGDYGIFAYDSVNGVLDHSYGSGSPDAAFYIGQCYPCEAILDDVIGEYSGLGYSGTNSGGDLYVVNSFFRKNSSGICPNTFDVELYPPQRETTIVGNVLIDNYNGIQVSGGNKNLVTRNYIRDSRGHGIMVVSAKDRNYWPATNNTFRDNVILTSARADLALSGLGTIGNCFEGNAHLTSTPWGLQMLQGCSGFRLPAVGDMNQYLRGQRGRAALLGDAGGVDPRGDEWKSLPHPPPQPQMPGSAAAPVRPAVHPFQDYGLDVDAIGLPGPADRERSPLVTSAGGGGR